MPKPIDQQLRDLMISQVMTVTTIPEAAKHWHKQQMTIRRAIDDGRLIARQAGGTWLISLSSIRALWGPAHTPIDPPGVR